MGVFVKMSAPTMPCYPWNNSYIPYGTDASTRLSSLLSADWYKVTSEPIFFQIDLFQCRIFSSKLSSYGFFLTLVSSKESHQLTRGGMTLHLNTYSCAAD